VRAVFLLAASWAAGLTAYAGASWGLRGESLSLDNWVLVAAITLLAWALPAALVTLPLLRRLEPRIHGRAGVLALAGGVLAILPIWLNLGLWYGWHPRHLLRPEAVPLAVLYGTSGVVLGLLLSRTDPRAPPPA
jgi:hypothetical protein